VSQKITFSDVTKDYAANFPVIERVRAEFRSNLRKFLDQLVEEVGRQVAPLVFSKSTPEKQWWMAASNVARPKERDAEWHGALLWFEDAFDTRHVDPGEMKLIAAVPCGDRTLCARVQAIAKRPEFADICTVNSSAAWYLFGAKLRYSEGDDVASVVTPIASLLRAMHEVCSEAM